MKIWYRHLVVPTIDATTAAEALPLLRPAEPPAGECTCQPGETCLDCCPCDECGQDRALLAILRRTR